jgi:hypothetical protein
MPRIDATKVIIALGAGAFLSTVIACRRSRRFGELSDPPYFVRPPFLTTRIGERLFQFHQSRPSDEKSRSISQKCGLILFRANSFFDPRSLQGPGQI